MRWICFVAVLAMSVQVLAAEPATQPQATWYWRRTVALSVGESALNHQRDIVPVIEEIEKKARALAPQRLGIPPQDADKFVSFTGNNYVTQRGSTATQATAEVRLDQKVAGVRPRAREFAKEITDMLMARLKEIDAADRKAELDEKRDEVKKAEVELDQTSNEFGQLRAELRQRTGRVDVSAASLNQAAPKLDDERQRLELDRLAKSARSKALQEAVAKLSLQAEEKVANDPIVAELSKVVEARETDVARMKELVNKRAASAQEVGGKIAEAAEARARLLERKRDAAAEAGGNMLESLNRELVMLSIDQAEQDTKLQAVEKQLAGLKDALDQLDQLTRLGSRIPGFQDRVESTANELEHTKKRIAQWSEPTMQVKEESATPVDQPQ